MEPLARMEAMYDDDYIPLDSEDDLIIGSDSETDDEVAGDFEREMQAELTRKMTHRREQQMGGSSSGGDHRPANRKLPGNESEDKDVKKDDDIVDEEDEDSDPLYDASLDEEDERWVDERRRQKIQAHLGKDRPSRGNSAQSQQAGAVPLPQSDAVLNCPACMTMLCLDCQRHQVFSNQYRAMFVENCRVDESVKLSCPLKGHAGDSSRRGAKRRRGSEAAASRNAELDDTARQQEYHPTEQATDDTPTSDLFHPVFCEKCNTQVAVMSAEDEVYHFYNIMASQS